MILDIGPSRVLRRIYAEFLLVGVSELSKCWRVARGRALRQGFRTFREGLARANLKET